MKDNKHPHYDLIVEWAKDTSKKVQFLSMDNDWRDCKDTSPRWDEGTEYRFKPREFTKGHWYPCLYNGGVSVQMWTGTHFVYNDDDWSEGKNSSCFDEIGESLGEINFG